MNWFKEHKRAWRVGFILMLALGMIGPWFFDRVSVPRPYPCSPPNVRLEGDFCGVPLSIVWIYGEIPAQFRYLMQGWNQPYVRSGWLMVLFATFLILPFISTLTLSVWTKWKWPTVFHRTSLGLAAGTGLLVVVLGFSGLSGRLWGVWLYIFLTVCMFIVEVFPISDSS